MKASIVTTLTAVLFALAIQTCVQVIDNRQAQYSCAQRQAMCLVREQSGREIGE
jgi:hypothetical protein